MTSPSASAPGPLALVVDEDVGTRWLLSELLRSRGHRVIAVADAAAAWQAFENGPVSLALLGLPWAAGASDLCRRLRAHPRVPDAMLLVVTEERDPAALQAMLDAGADDYLGKPVDLALLGLRLAVAEREMKRRGESDAAERRWAIQSEATRALLANLDKVIFSIDPQAGQLLSVSAAAQRILSRSPEELMRDQTLWSRLLYPPEVAQLEDELIQHPERALQHRWEIRQPDGSLRWVEVSVKGALDPEGHLTRVDAVLSDVTDRQRFQEEIAVRNQELMTLYRISEVTLSASSTEHAYHDLLEEVCRATGFPIATIERYDAATDRLTITAVRGIPLHGGPLEIPAHETLSGIAVRTGKPVVETNARDRPEMAHPLLRALGIRTWLAFPMVVGRGVLGTLTLAHPDSVNPDRRLLRWAGSLASAVAQFLDRTGAEDALRESERRHRELAEQLQQANQELERFAYSVSHDLRAPLRTMQGFAHALIQNYGERLPAEARDYAQRIIASGQQSEVLIRDLLAYSQLSFEEMELHEVKLAQVVAPALDQLEGDIREAGAEVTVEGKLPMAIGHSTTLVQVVANLLSNAIKFTSAGHPPRIRLRAQEGERFVRLWVEDSGIGVPPGQEDRIFRVFERLTEGGSRPGTGIGLAVVRRGMERMGGRSGVVVDPKREGSSFWVDILHVGSEYQRPPRLRREGG